MSSRPPGTPKTEEELRLFTLDILHSWIKRLDQGKLPFHVPKLRGIMSIQPGKIFHLRPELFLQISGETIFEFPEETVPVRGGEVCLVPRGLPHYERARPWRGPFANLVFLFNTKELSYHIAHENSHGRPTITLASRIANPPPMLAILLGEASKLAHSPITTRASGLKGLLLAHFSLLATALEGVRPPHEEEPFKVMQARQWILSELPDPHLSVSHLAKQLHCNADYLSQLFRKTTGTPMQAYITQHRLNRAHDLLESSTLNIAEVSQAAGFNDPSYFTRAFRRWYGYTPRELRSNHPGSI